MFLCSDENKARLQHLIKNYLHHVTNSISRDLICSKGKFVWNVSKNLEILDLKCNQIADIIMFSIYYNIHSTDKDKMVVTDYTDVDCYGQAAAISKKIQGPNLTKITVQFYMNTGCDSNNGFYSYGKNEIYDKISWVSHL